MKKIKNVKKRCIKNVVDKLTKLIKPSQKFSSKITFLICMTTFEGYTALHDRIFYSCHVKSIT